MKSATLGRSSGTWAGLLLALLAWVLIAPRPALAGCAHDVRFQSLPVGASIGLELLDGAGALAEPSSPTPGDLPERHAPCSGAMCSGQPAVPLSTAPPDFQRAGSWALLAVPTQIPATEPASSLLDEGDPRPTHSGGSIFHPPRPSRSLLID